MKTKYSLMIISFVLLLLFSGCYAVTPGITDEASIIKSSNSYAEQSSEISSGPSESWDITPAPTIPPTEHTKTRYVNVAYANFRSGPSTDHSVIRILRKGNRLEYIRKDGDWSYVSFSDCIYGYIYSELVSESKPDTSDMPELEIPVLDSWPDELSVDTVYDPELDKYIGRYSGEGYYPLKGITVILDPGHGGEDKGYSYFSDTEINSETNEKTVVLEIAQKLEDELENMGAKVILTRREDFQMGLFARCAFINSLLIEKIVETTGDTLLEGIKESFDAVLETNSDFDTYSARGIMKGFGASPELRALMDHSSQMDDVILVSLHCSYSDHDNAISGTKIYYGTNDSIRLAEEEWLEDAPFISPINPSYYMYDDFSRKRFAEKLSEKLSDQTELDPRGEGIFESGECILREVNITSASIHLGYLSDPDDRTFLTEPAGQRRTAHAISPAIYEFYCLGSEP